MWKMFLLAQAADAQSCCNGASARCEECADQKHLHVFPNTLGKLRGEVSNQGRQIDRQCQHHRTSLGGVVSSLRCLNVFSKTFQMDKVELSGCAKVLDYFESWTFRLMKARPQVPQQRFGSGPQHVPVGPPAVAAQFVLHMTPDPLHQVQFLGICW